MCKLKEKRQRILSMHIFLTIISFIAVWVRRDYRNWERMYPTMQYIALGNLTYNFLCAAHWLWRMSPDIDWYNFTLLEMGYTFVVFPATALMFLSRYPEGEGFWRIVRHYLCWIGIYVGFEYIMQAQGTIVYKYGWSLGWSAIFDCIMFPFLRMHYKKPLLTFLLSIPMALFWLWLFDIPTHIPIEKR